jgi:hydrogenase-4 component E
VQHEALLAQASTLGASLILLCGIALLWRRSISAYITLFQWQSLCLAALCSVIGALTGEAELYVVAATLFGLKVVVIPRLLRRLQQRLGVDREVDPYVNVATSLIVAGLLVLLAYAITRPLVTASTLPTRAGLPLAIGLIFVGLFVITTRKKALTQVVGFLVLENGVALLAILGSLGIPLFVEMGVFLDVLMGFLVMQVFVYHIHQTFDSMDVEQLRRLKDE